MKRILLSLALAIPAFVPGIAEAQSSDRPNMVLFLFDNHGESNDLTKSKPELAAHLLAGSHAWKHEVGADSIRENGEIEGRGKK